MALFVAGLALFIAIHLVRVVAPGAREAAIQRFGEAAWKGVYSLVSLVALVLVGRGYGEAYGATAMLYDPPAWGRHVLWVVMALAFVLAVASNGPSGRIRTWVQDPLLIATILWAAAHLFVRSDWLHVLLFGGFLAWAAVTLIDTRRRRAAGLVARAEGRSLAADGVAVVVGLGLYLLFMAWAHEWLFGVSPVV